MINKVFVFTITIILLIPVSTFAGSKEVAVRSLVNLPSVRVNVFIVDEMKKYINANEITADIEKELKTSNIFVEGMACKNSYLGFLIVNIFGYELNATTDSTEVELIYSLSMELHQEMILARDYDPDKKYLFDYESNFIGSSTWGRNNFGTYSATEINNEIGLIIKDMTNDFINDYQKANPDHNK